jgi:hypothetical protein
MARPAPTARLALVATTLLVAAAPSVRAQTAMPAAPPQDNEASRAAKLRAMVILKMAPYFSLEAAPATRATEFRIGVVGDDAVVQSLRSDVAGKKVNELPVVIVGIDPKDAASGKLAAKYDVLYLACSVDEPSRKAIIASHADKPTPLVAEQTGFAQSGGAVQLFVKDNTVRFEINAEALKKQGVRASPQFLKLSRKGPA